MLKNTSTKCRLQAWSVVSHGLAILGSTVAMNTNKVVPEYQLHGATARLHHKPLLLVAGLCMDSKLHTA